MKYLNIYYRPLVYLTSFTVFSGDILKKNSKNLTGHFHFYFCPNPTLKMKEKSRKSTYKKACLRKLEVDKNTTGRLHYKTDAMENQ